MNLAQGWRTARSMTVNQLLWRILCRGRFVIHEEFPQMSMRHYRRLMNTIAPLPFPPDVAKVMSAHIIQLQRAVHGPHAEDILRGRFTLLNREVDFCNLELVDWRCDLGEGNNRLWRMNLGYMGYLVPLFEKDPQVAMTVACSLLTSLRKQNPWRCKGVFRDIWHPYTVSHRVINLLTCYSLWCGAGMPRESSGLDEMVSEIRFGIAFLLENLERDLQYNHLLKNLVCLVYYSAFAQEASLPTLLLKEIEKAISQQTLQDGGPAERSPMYHLLSLIDLRILRDSAILPAQLTTAVCDVIGISEQAVNAMIHPDGDIALFNDSWIGEAPRAVDMIDGLECWPEDFLHAELPSTGYLRLAQGGDSAVMDFGACGPDENPGHAHADFLSIELSVNGFRAVVDPAVPTYSDGELRDLSRSAQYHNGPAFEREEPIEFWGSFRVARRGYAYKLALELPGAPKQVFAAWQDGYDSINAFVARAIWLKPGEGLLIADAWSGVPHRSAVSRFMIGDLWMWQASTRFSSAHNGGTDCLSFEPIDGEILEELAVPYWEGFGVEHRGTMISVTPNSSGPFRICGLWIGWSKVHCDYRVSWQALSAELERAARSLRNSRF